MVKQRAILATLCLENASLMGICCSACTSRRLTNLMEALRAELRRKPYQSQKAALFAILNQLEGEWRQYQAGTLPALDPTTPF
jgi:hypothetical protein